MVRMVRALASASASAAAAAAAAARGGAVAETPAPPEQPSPSSPPPPLPPPSLCTLAAPRVPRVDGEGGGLPISAGEFITGGLARVPASAATGEFIMLPPHSPPPPWNSAVMSPPPSTAAIARASIASKSDTGGVITSTAAFRLSPSRLALSVCFTSASAALVSLAGDFVLLADSSGLLEVQAEAGAAGAGVESAEAWAGPAGPCAVNSWAARSSSAASATGSSTLTSLSNPPLPPVNFPVRSPRSDFASVSRTRTSAGVSYCVAPVAPVRGV
mmetsp:Transcript_38218/g.94974  ORF Transcript_38218/g.94974 Transcript_38218/m.94974 type:complete len:273 (-) Transcript_38218:304-1122(-)